MALGDYLRELDYENFERVVVEDQEGIVIFFNAQFSR